MGIRTVLSEDADSAPLNDEAHAVEHCAVDSESLGALGSAVGRQLLIRQASHRAPPPPVVEEKAAPPPRPSWSTTPPPTTPSRSGPGSPAASTAPPVPTRAGTSPR